MRTNIGIYSAVWKMAARRSAAREDFDFYNVQENSGNSNVPAFLTKLWTLVEDPSNTDIISWDVKGTSFHIFDQSRFASEVLPYYFKHNNVSSFVRQLNMYGFRKVPNMEQGGLKVERDDVEFQHQFFVRGHEELLERIKRKTGQSRVEQRPVNVDTDGVSKILTEVKQIKGKQDSLSTSMADLTRENQVLWREFIKLSQKHAQQQQIVNKLLQFLLSLVNKHGRGMSGLTRKRPLMIDNTPQNTQATEVSPAKKANICMEHAVDHEYTVESPQDLKAHAVPSTSGVVIQELSDPLLVPPSTAVVKTEATTPPQTAPVSLEFSEPSVFDQAVLSAGILPPSYSQSVTTATTSPTQPPANPAQTVEQPQEQGEWTPSNQLVLRVSSKDKPLSASASPSSSTREMTERLNHLQRDIEHVRENLSSGQYSIDPNFLLGLFDPESPLPVSIDSSFLESLASEAGNADLESTLTAAPVSSTALGSITGNELSQYNPTDVPLPSLFDDLDTDKLGEPPTPLQSVAFDADDVLNTPTVADSKPLLADDAHFNITAEDLD